MKKYGKIFAIIAIILLLIYGSVAVCFFASTESVSQIEKNCLELSNRNAVRVQRYGDGLHSDYAFWVTIGGSNSAPQELFVYKEKNLLFTSYKRFAKVMDTIEVNSQNHQVGCLQFTFRDETGEKEPTDTMIFYSSNQDQIDRCTYVLQVNGVEEKIEKQIASKKEFVLFIPYLGKTDQPTRILNSAGVYDANEKDICQLSFP